MPIPYLSAPGNISKAFTAIQLAATPERVSQDFVKTVLKIPGGSGDQMTAFLRRLGFVGSDGSPTELYRQYRNPDLSRQAMGRAIKRTYTDLEKRNEYYHSLADEKLKQLIIEETGEAADSRNVALMLQTLKNLISLADFDSTTKQDLVSQGPTDEDPQLKQRQSDREAIHNTAGSTKPVGMNLSYTINLNLPATTDIEVFNAIFKSLREHLLNDQ